MQWARYLHKGADMYLNGNEALFYIFKALIVLFLWFVMQFFYKATLFCDDGYDYRCSKGKNKLIYALCWAVFMPFYTSRTAVLVLLLDVVSFVLLISLRGYI